jgi:hypothetical protein
MFVAPVCVAFALPTVGVPPVGVAEEPATPGAGPPSSGVCSIPWSISLSFVTPAEPDVVTPWSVANGPDPAAVPVVVPAGRVLPAEAVAVFVCVTAPLSPGLATRTTTLTLSGSFCVAVAFAWPPPAVPSPLPVAAAAACDAFDWSTAPWPPSLPTLIVTFELSGEDCPEVAVAVPVGSEPSGGTFELVSVEACESAVFDWPTGSLEPPCPTSTATLPFCGAV